MKTWITIILTAVSLNSAFASSPELSTQSWLAPPPSRIGKNNTWLVDEDPATGFAVYRASKPNAKDMQEFCKLGITEMMVLSGTAAKHEAKFAKDCPTLKVVYNTAQDDKVPLDSNFLRDFDDWVQDAHAKGKKIAFRCECGCHRTGRLAAYYQMKYQKLPVDDALAILQDHGQWMLFFPHIPKQVRALSDYIAGRACSQKAKYCVRD